MEAKEIKFLDLLGKPNTQFIVPVFQRVYSWDTRQCEDLVDDIATAAASKSEHFLGPFLYSLAADSWGNCERLQIIDGQQRMTTVTLMLLAVARHLRETKSTLEDGTSATDLAKRFLFANDETSAKLLLTSIDRDMLEYLVGAAPEPEDTASRLKDCLELFESKIGDDGIDLNTFWDGLNKLQVISIELSGEDSPQLVFESLNSKGKRLAIDDLVRNALLMQTEQDATHTGLYKTLWAPMEDAISEIDNIGMDSVIMCWLASEHDDVHIKSEDEMYAVFRDTLSVDYDKSYEALLSDLKTYCFSFIHDEQLRTDAMKLMERWRAGKPKKIISELKMFGD